LLEGGTPLLVEVVLEQRAQELGLVPHVVLERLQHLALEGPRPLDAHHRHQHRGKVDEEQAGANAHELLHKSLQGAAQPHQGTRAL
jgi:hypothetical protein